MRGALRDVVHEAGNTVEDIASCKESPENLSIVAVNPFAPDLPGVLAPDDREIVTDVGAPKDFIYGRLKEEWRTEAECRGKAHGRVRHAGRIDGVARAVFSSVGEMGLVQHGVGECAEPVAVNILNFRRAFDSISTRAVCRNVKGLIGILGPVKAVRAKNLVLRVQVIVHAAKYRGIALLVDTGESFVSVLEGRREGRRLKETDQGNALAIGVGIDYRVRSGGSVIKGARGGGSGAGGALIFARPNLSVALGGGRGKTRVLHT